MNSSAALSGAVAFRADATTVRVPATSANLGPGFDALGLALGLYDEVTARVGGDGDLFVDVSGEDAVPRDGSNLVVRAMRAAFDRVGSRPRGLQLSCVNRIPHGRGLGSSAAAIVGGVLLARSLVLDGAARLPDQALLPLASALEGHPDNVAACLLGGLTVAWTVADQSSAVRLECDPSVQPVVLIPPSPSATAGARRLLPANVPHRDAAFNAARAALLVAALTGRPDTLFDATEDRLHQPYRADATPASAELLVVLRGLGIPAVISGAGPTVLALTRDRDELARTVERAPAGWAVEIPAIDRIGARVLR
ncbi:MAG: homoserine kinase [Actinomycetota bacterium]